MIARNLLINSQSHSSKLQRRTQPMSSRRSWQWQNRSKIGWSKSLNDNERRLTLMLVWEPLHLAPEPLESLRRSLLVRMCNNNSLVVAVRVTFLDVLGCTTKEFNSNTFDRRQLLTHLVYLKYGDPACSEFQSIACSPYFLGCKTVTVYTEPHHPVFRFTCASVTTDHPLSTP